MIYGHEDVPLYQKSYGIEEKQTALSAEQIVIINNYAGRLNLSQKSVSEMMGLLGKIRKHSQQEDSLSASAETEAEAVSL
ncbi:MAG TPA: hypothetical protein DHM90_09985 [Clostridiaceae bacterium]|nr:hypothetical protein [Clostridiaceae bacterium]